MAKPTQPLVPFRGGMDTRREKALIPHGGYSEVYNMRNRHPGMEKRTGMDRKHTTADGTNKCVSLYQFSKGRRAERHFLAQMSDGDVLDATDAPPTKTTGAFGGEVHDGTSSGMIPASFSDVNDVLIYSNGSDQHQCFAGDDNYVSMFVAHKGTVTPPDIPVAGLDYTTEVIDGKTTTYAVLDDLGAFGTTLVTNGTFPSDIASWDDNSVGDATVAFDTDHAELDANTGTAEMGQTITLISGANYTLTFDIAENCTGLDVTGGTSAYAGTEHFTETYTATGSKTINFTAAGASLFLEFVSGTDEVVSLDNIALISHDCLFICSPVPATNSHGHSQRERLTRRRRLVRLNIARATTRGRTLPKLTER